MTKQISFATPKGANVVLTLLTEEAMIADAAIIKKCWRLTVTVDGAVYGFCGRKSHPTAGQVLDLGSNGVAIPTDYVAAVDALIAEYRAGKPQADYADYGSDMRKRMYSANSDH